MSDAVTLALCGDLMIGRGVDQVLPDPCPPTLHEEYVQNANDYVALAERASGTIPRPVDLAYPWGDSLDELEEIQPDAWIVNLETALTRSDRPWRGKAVNYRASPQNARMLAAGGVDCCALANNHVLDWGREGLTETIATLDGLGVRHAGAGADRAGAEAPAELGLDDGTRVLVFSLATTSSGVPKDWVASGRRPGVALIADLSEGSRAEIIQRVRSHRRGGDILVISIHWGGNWDFEVPPQQRDFARGLVDAGAADLVHGHSSHHVKGIEVYRGRPILYGCGDFLTDYEGISGHHAYRGELGLLYFVTLDRAGGGLIGLRMKPTRVTRLQVQAAGTEDARWLADTLNRQCARFGTSVLSGDDGRLELRWDWAPRPASSLGPRA